MLNIGIVVLCDQEVAFRIHTVLDLGDRKKDDNDQCDADITEITHCNSEQRPDCIPVEHSEISAVIGKADPASDEGSAEYLDKTGEEGDDEAGFESALFIGDEADGGIIKEYRNESADDDRGRSKEDQGDDSNDLSGKTCEEAEGNSVGVAETVADCAVNTGYGCGQELVSDSLEGSCELGNECADTKLEDRKINSELQAGVEYIECEGFGLFRCAAGYEEVLADDAHDDAEEYGHQDGCADHVLIEDGEEAGHLEIADLLDFSLAALVSEELVSKPVSEADTEHLLMRDGKSGAFCELLHGLDGQVGSDCPVGSEDDGHDEQKSYVVLTQSGQREQDEPVCGCSLLYLDVSGGEKGAALRDLVEADEEDVDDEGDEQQGHDLCETFSECLLDSGCNCVLTIVGIDDAGGEVEAVLETGKDGTEVAGQSAGTDVEDQHADDGFKSPSQCVVPLLAHEAVAYKGEESDHVRSFLQDVGCKKVPYCA